MGNIDLASLIVGVAAGVGLTQLVMWVLMMVRHPGFDYLQRGSAREEPKAR